MFFFALFVTASFTFANNGNPQSAESTDQQEFTSIDKLEFFMVEGQTVEVKGNVVRCKSFNKPYTCIAIVPLYKDVQQATIFKDGVPHREIMIQGFNVRRYDALNGATYTDVILEPAYYQPRSSKLLRSEKVGGVLPSTNRGESLQSERVGGVLPSGN